MMKKWVVLAAVAILLGGFAFAAAPARLAAQTGSGTPVTCDSTLVLLFLVAERNYGYTPSVGIDISGLDYGQYGTLHSNLMDTAMATEEAATSGSDTSSSDTSGSDTAGAMMTPAVGASGTMLQPGNVAGENATCTTLRADLEAFLFNRLAASTTGMSTDMGAGSTSGDLSVTAEATASG
jgi:hypothetical protein